PGQFLQIVCRDDTDSAAAELIWDGIRMPAPRCAEFYQREAFLRRPFSIADRTDDANGAARLAIISRNIGAGTAWLETLAPGDVIDVTGPLGRGFVIPPDESPLVLIGGGVGIPPLLYLARAAAERGRRDVTLILGVMSGELLPVKLRCPP